MDKIKLRATRLRCGHSSVLHTIELVEADPHVSACWFRDAGGDEVGLSADQGMEAIRDMLDNGYTFSEDRKVRIDVRSDCGRYEAKFTEDEIEVDDWDDSEEPKP